VWNIYVDSDLLMATGKLRREQVTTGYATNIDAL
jgi:hypothetical protein